MSPERTRPGKRKQRKAERREAILDFAQRRFLDDGYSRVSMSSVAEAIGGSKGTLWSYFSSKQALFEAVIGRAAERLRADLIDVLDLGEKLEEGLCRFAEAFICRITTADAIALQRMVVGETTRSPEVGRIFYACAPAAMSGLLAIYMAKQMEAGQLRRHDPLKAAEIFLSLCDGGHHKRVLWGVESYCDATAAAEAEKAANAFLRAYSPDASK